MRCEKCKQNVATIRIQQSVNGEKTDTYLCGNCSGDIEMLLLLENIFHGFLSKPSANHTPVFKASARRKVQQPTCASCGITFEELKQEGTLGCAACYQSFYGILEPLLINAHAAVYHEGKLPKRGGIALKRQRQLDKLRGHMQEAIDLEDFDRAAFLRDKIRNFDMPQGAATTEDGKTAALPLSPPNPEGTPPQQNDDKPDNAANENDLGHSD